MNLFLRSFVDLSIQGDPNVRCRIRPPQIRRAITFCDDFGGPSLAVRESNGKDRRE